MIDYKPNSLEYMLSAGRGKAIQEILRQGTDPHKDLILDQCLHNKAYDPQLAGNRADYLYPLLKASGEKAFFRNAILGSILDAKDSNDASQLCNFALNFAGEGDEEARNLLYEKFRRNDVEFWSFGCGTQLIDLDGVDGLLRVLDVGASDSRLFDSLSGDDYLIRYAEDECGAELVRQALESAQKSNPNIAKFLESVSGSYTPSLKLSDIIKSHAERNPVQVLRALVEGLSWQEFKPNPKSTMLAATWGRYATSEEVENAARDILIEEDTEKLKWYLRIFWKRDFPLYPGLLVKLLDNPNAHVSFTVLRALSKLSHPEVRRLFDRLVINPAWYDYALRLLARNYREGDHLIIQQLLEAEVNVERLHRLSRDACDIFKANSVPNSVPSLVLIYDKTPCSSCRERAVELLDTLEQLPDWILDECRYDCREDLRKLAQERLGPSA